jgi:predicted MFS family arabinose efflux permease
MLTGTVARAWLVFAVFAAAHFLSYFFRSANAVIADDLTASMGLSPAQLGLMSGLFFGFFALAQLPFGSALDRYGARITTSVLMLVGVVGALVFAAAPNVAWLGVGRALLGLGTAGILMGGLKALSQIHPPRRFAAVAGMLTATGSSGALVATAPLALLNRAVGWRAVFAGGAVLLLLGAVAIAAVVRTPRTDPHPQAPAGSFRDIFGSAAFWRLAFLGFAVMGTTFAYQSLWAGPYLTEAAGLSTAVVGNVLLWLGIGLVLGFFVSGWLAQRFGPARVVAVATLLMVLVQAALALVAGTGAAPAALGALLFLLAGSGSFALLLYAQANVLFPARLTGRAVTAINLFMFLGGFVLQWGIGNVVNALAPTGGGASPGAYATALALTAALCAAALLVYLPTLGRPGGVPG